MTRRLLETTTAIGLLTMVVGAGVAHAQDDAAMQDGVGAELVRCVLEAQPCPDATDADISAAVQMLADQTGATIADAEARIREALPEPAVTGEEPETAETETQPAETEAAAEADAGAAETPPAEDETAAGQETTDAAEPSDALDEAMDAVEEGEQAAGEVVEEPQPETDAEAGDAAEAGAEGEAPPAETATDDAAGEGEEQQAETETPAQTGAETAAGAETETGAETTAADETGGETGEELPAEPTGDAAAATDETDATAENEAAAETTETDAEAAARAEAEADQVAPEPTPEQRAARAERQAQRQADRGNAEALQAADQEIEAETEAESQADVQVETVTEETARRSDETVEAEATGQQDTDQLLRNILGIAAGATVGAVLGNQFNVVEPAGDRVVVERDGELVVLRDENELLRRPGTEVRTRTFEDGSTRTVVIRENGVRIVTIRAYDGTILYRARVAPDGQRVVLIDERQYEPEPVDISRLPSPPRARVIEYGEADVDTIRSALAAEVPRLDRRYSLQQVRDVRELRALVPGIDLAVNFATGSAAIPPSEAEALTALGRTVERMIAEDPDELFLVEGHTDTVGAAAYNLALSDRRAESVALALTEYFDIPPENLVTQGYGERFLKVEQAGDIRANRRAVVRRITPLVRAAGAQ